VDYGRDMEDNLFKYQPDFSNSLKNTEISISLRSRMVDWMIEVFANYFATASDQTFFMAVGLMDLYHKHSKKKLRESDVHLNGMAAMFISSKFDDVYHIPLKDFVERIGHSKFTGEEIKAKEWDILSTLNFNVNIHTQLDYLNRILFKNFHDDSHIEYLSIKENAIYMLKMTMYEYQMTSYKPKVVVMSVMCYLLKVYFLTLTQNGQIVGNGEESTLINNMITNCGEVDLKELDRVLLDVSEIVGNFEARFPDLKNIHKYDKRPK